MIRSFLITALVTIGLGGQKAEAQYRYGEPGPNRVVASWYRHFMGREPDAAGLQGFVWHVQNGMSYRDALANFLGSDEYYVRKGNNPEAFIIGLYRDLLSREPNREEMRIQLDQMFGSGERKNYVRNFLIATQYDRASRVMAPPAAPPPAAPPPPAPPEEVRSLPRRPASSPPPPPPEEERYLPPPRRQP